MKNQIICTIKNYTDGVWTEDKAERRFNSNMRVYRNPNYSYALVFSEFKYRNYLETGKIIEK